MQKFSAGADQQTTAHYELVHVEVAEELALRSRRRSSPSYTCPETSPCDKDTATLINAQSEM